MKSFLMLLAGVGIGVGVSWVYHKNKYEQLVEEELESVREHSRKYTKEDYDKANRKEDASRQPISKDEAIKNYNEVIKDNAYSHEPEKDIFIVTPDDFSTIPGYDADSLNYHTNDIISNDDEEEVDVEDLLGMTALEIKDHFGQYEEDAVYIRNTLLHTDYEILRSLDDFEPIDR